MTVTTKEFWDKYINEDILEIFEVTFDFFSKKLPKEFIEDYDVEEVILETRGHHETAKNFDNVIRFSELLQKKQPKLYKENFQYFDDFLIDYYCFHKDYNKVESSFSNFILNPTHDFDKYLISFRKLLFYGYTDILNVAITKNYKKVETSDELIGNAGYDLALSKFYLTLEKFHLSDNFDTKTFLTKLNKYDFDFNDDFLLAVETGMCEQLSKEDIVNNFLNDRQNFIITLEIFFLKYMQERKISFAISGRIWDKILVFWSENNDKKKCSPDDFFQVKVDELEKYLSNLSGDMFIDNKSEMIAVLWGSVYVYDFLKTIEIINQDTFDNFIKTTKILKGKVIGQFTSDLWNSNFVHLWEKPDSISTIEFIEEEKIFKKSILFTHQKFTRLRSKISKELANIGELATYIIEGGKTKENDYNTSLLDDIFDTNQGDKTHKENRISEPIKVEKKVGRNEPCPCGSGKKYKKCCGK
jgi:hypothetical protein